jgi:hypothetical protein
MPWVKITNCTTTTGGGKIPSRLRHNQNVRVNVSEETIEYIENNKGTLYWNRRNGTFWFHTTSDSKVIRK